MTPDPVSVSFDMSLLVIVLLGLIVAGVVLAFRASAILGVGVFAGLAVVLIMGVTFLGLARVGMQSASPTRVETHFSHDPVEPFKSERLSVDASESAHTAIPVDVASAPAIELAQAADSGTDSVTDSATRSRYSANEAIPTRIESPVETHSGTPSTLLLVTIVVGFFFLLASATTRKFALLGGAALLAMTVVYWIKLGRSVDVGSETRVPHSSAAQAVHMPSYATPSPPAVDAAKPAWVDKVNAPTNTEYQKAVQSGVFKDAIECEKSLNEEIELAAWSYLDHIDTEAAHRVTIDVAEIRNRLSPGEYWWETVESPTVGKMLRLHAVVTFDVLKLRQLLRDTRIDTRVKVAGLASGATLAILGATFLLLRKPPKKQAEEATAAATA